MAVNYDNVNEKCIHTSPVPDTPFEEKSSAFQGENAHVAAERGHVATDRHGVSLVTFDPKVEARLRLKIDLYILPTVALLYLFCFIDRANIGNARLAGLERDLGMANYDYNIVLSCFYVSYTVFEIPSNIVCKLMGPGWLIPILSLGFGICSVGTAWVNDFSQLCAVRFLLGVFEAGMVPGIAYYLSRWYRRSELSFRCGIFIVMAPTAGAFGGLMASAILRLDSIGSLEGWRMIFLVEGIITCGLALISFFTFTDRPETARWLTTDEKDMAIARIKSERIATTEVLDKIGKAKTLRGVFSPVVIATSLIALFDNITVQGLAFFAPTIVRTIYPHQTTVSLQLRTVPPYFVGGLFTLLITFLSWRFDRRNMFIIVCAPLIMIGYTMFLATTDGQIRYAATFLIASGAYSAGPLCIAQVSGNVVSDTARSAAIATGMMFANLGGLISTWSFLPFDGPNYHIGNGLNLATSSTVLLFAISLQYWMWNNNKKRAKADTDSALDGLTLKQIQDLDWRHPAFRWKP